MSNLKKKVVGVVSTVPVVAATALPVLASESGTANTAVVSAMTTTANDMIATGTAVVPVALTVVGLMLVVTFGIRIFKGIAKK